MVQRLWKTEWRVLKKLNVKLLYDQEILLLVIFQRNLNQNHKETFAFPMFLNTLFEITTIREKLLSTISEWIKKMWYMHIGKYLAFKKKEILPFVTTWMKLGDIMLRELSQS